MDYTIAQLFSSSVSETLTPVNVLIILGVSIGLGLIVSLIYMLTHKKDGYTAAFVVTLITLAPIVAIVILLIGNNVARAFSLAGAFALIRFRSAPGDPKDIAYVFFSVVIGLACGMGYMGYAAIFTVVLSLVLLVLSLINFGEKTREIYDLKITVPENLNYVGSFDDLLGKYTDHAKIARIRTVDFGALFELTYRVTLKKDCDTKAFIDEIRTRNGNLKIVLGLPESKSKDFHF